MLKLDQYLRRTYRFYTNYYRKIMLFWFVLLFWGSFWTILGIEHKFVDAEKSNLYDILQFLFCTHNCSSLVLRTEILENWFVAFACGFVSVVVATVRLQLGFCNCKFVELCFAKPVLQSWYYNVSVAQFNLYFCFAYCWCWKLNSENLMLQL